MERNVLFLYCIIWNSTKCIPSNYMFLRLSCKCILFADLYILRHSFLFFLSFNLSTEIRTRKASEIVFIKRRFVWHCAYCPQRLGPVFLFEFRNPWKLRGPWVGSRERDLSKGHHNKSPVKQIKLVRLSPPRSSNKSKDLVHILDALSQPPWPYS